MKVVILCGGKGTRLREHVESIPKALIEIGGRPILWHIMKIYSAHGFNEFILCLGYKGQMIKEYFMDYLSWKHHDFTLDLGTKAPSLQLLNHDRENWKITFADTGEDTNTGGRIKRIASLLSDEAFMLTYGDGVANVNIKDLAEFHLKHGKIGTITAVTPILQFGLLKLDAGGVVKNFQEKPIMNEWINGGFFIFKRKFLNYLDEQDALEKNPLEKLAQEGQLMAYQHKDFWKCMDTYKDTVSLNELWNTGKAPWKIW